MVINHVSVRPGSAGRGSRRTAETDLLTEVHPGSSKDWGRNGPLFIHLLAVGFNFF